jgi:hypothetical protein
MGGDGRLFFGSALDPGLDDVHVGLGEFLGSEERLGHSGTLLRRVGELLIDVGLVGIPWLDQHQGRDLLGGNLHDARVGFGGAQVQPRLLLLRTVTFRAVLIQNGLYILLEGHFRLSHRQDTGKCRRQDQTEGVFRHGVLLSARRLSIRPDKDT